MLAPSVPLVHSPCIRDLLPVYLPNRAQLYNNGANTYRPLVVAPSFLPSFLLLVGCVYLSSLFFDCISGKYYKRRMNRIVFLNRRCYPRTGVGVLR